MLCDIVSPHLILYNNSTVSHRLILYYRNCTVSYGSV